MAENQYPLYYGIGADNSEFLKAFEEMHRVLNKTARLTDTQANQMAKSLMRVEDQSRSTTKAFTRLAAQIGGGVGLVSLSKKIVEVRGEFQQLEIAFETMLNSKEKSDRLMMEAVEFAAKTPFTLTDVASNIKQLMAMGVAVEEVMSTMKSLGDVAAGVSVPISRVAINYGQVLTMGKLQGRELRDFAMAGIPLVDELAKNLGVAKSEIQAMVEAGRIGAEEVTKAFRTMSSEGGKFYNLMEKQNASVTGQISNLKDKVEVMFNNLGKSSEGVIYNMISGAATLVENYKDVLSVLTSLVAAYGAYRASLMTMTAIGKASASIQYQAEITELLKLLPLKEQSANADIQAALAKGTLTQAQAEQIVSLRLEIASELESLKTKAAIALQAKTVAAEEAKLALQRTLAAKALVRQRMDEFVAASNSNNMSAMAAAQTAYETAVDQRAAAVKASKVAMINLNAARSKANAAATAVDTLQTKVNTATDIAAAKSKNLLTVATGRLTASFKAMGLAFKSNPVGMIISAIALLIPLVSRLTEKQREAKEVTNRAKEQFRNETNELKALREVLGDSNIAYHERKKALDKIQELVPGYHASLTKEGQLIDNNTQAIDKYLDKLEKQIEMDLLKKDLQDAIALRDKVRDEGMSFWEKLTSSDLSTLERWLSLSGTKKAQEENADRIIERLNGLIENIRGKIAEASREDSLVGPLLPDGFDRELGRIKTANDLIKEARKNVTEAERAFNEVMANQAKYASPKEWAEAIKEASENLKNAEKTLSTLTGIDTNEWNKVQEEYNEWLLKSAEEANDELVKLQLRQEQERIDAMEDGAAKRKAQFELEQKESLALMQKYTRDVVNEQAKLAKNQGMVAGFGRFEVGLDGTLAYNLAKNGLTPTAEQLSVIEEMVSQWNQRIVDMWVDKQVDLDPDSGQNLVDDLLAQINAKLIAGLKGGGFDPLKEQASLIFADISELSATMIRQIITNVEDYISNNDVSDEALAQYRQAIDRANEYLVEKNPWGALKVAQERYAKALKDFNNSQEQTDPEKRIKAQNQAILDQAAALSTVRKAYEEIGSIIKEFAGFGFDIAELFGVDGNILSGIEQMVDGAIKLSGELGILVEKTKKVSQTAVEATTEISKATETAGEGIAQVGGSVASTGAGMVGAIIAIVGAVIQIGGAVAQVVQTVKQQKINIFLEGVQHRLENIANVIKSIATMPGLGDSFLTEDMFNKVARLNEALIVLQRSMMQFMGTYSGKQTDDVYKYVQKIIDMMLKVPAYHGLSITDSVFGKLDVQQMRETLTYLKGITEAMKDSEEKGWAQEAIGFIEQYLEYYDQLRDVLSNMLGDLSSNILSTVNSMWKEIRDGGLTTFADLTKAAKKDIAEVVDQMASQQLWAATMGTYFDQLGEDLAETILNKGDIIGVFDTFWTGMEQGLEGYTAAYEAFLKSAEDRGWDMSSGSKAGITDTTAPEGSIRAMREELSKLQEQWNNLTAEEREGDLGKQLFGDIEDLKEKIQLAEDLYNTKSIETLIQQQERLNALYQEWVEMYGQETADEMLAGLGANPDDYIKALEARRDELQALDELTAEQQEELTDILSKINSIYDAAHEAAAEVSQEAYNAWSDALSDSLSNAASDYERLAAYQAAYLIALNDSVMGEEERARALEESSKNAEELKKQITANLRETYRTDEEQREIDLSTFKADLEWANSQGLPDLAKNIQDAWNAYLLEDWEKGFEDSLDGYDTYLEKYKEIIKSLTELDETSSEGAAQYLLDKKAELERKMQSELYDKYKTDEQEYLDNLKDYENDIAEALAIGNTELAAEAARQRDEYISDYLAEIMESTEGWEALMGELSEMTREEAEAAIEEARKYLNETEGLSEEYKQEQLAKLREIEKQLDDLDFENLIESAKEVLEVFDSLIGVLEAMGADTQVIDNLREVSSLASSIVSAVSSFASGNIVGGIVSVIGAITSGISLINQLMDPYARKIAEATAEVERQERAYNRLQKAISNTLGKSDVAEKKAQAIAVQQSIIAALQEQLKAEQEKKQSWWDPLGWFTSGPDEEKIANLTDAINDAYAEINAIVESMVDDFFGQDVGSIVSKYADVLSTPFDNALDKAKALRAASKEIVKQMVLDWAKAQLLSPEIKSVLDGYYADNKDKAFTKESLNGLMGDLEGATSEFSSFIESLQDVWGTEDVDSSATSAIKSITQPQANELLGIATGMRIIQNEMKNDQKTMGQDMAEMARLNAEMLEVVRDIRDNSDQLHELPKIRQELSKISSNNSLHGTGLNV